jgi:hypothetical protein
MPYWLFQPSARLARSDRPVESINLWISIPLYTPWLFKLPKKTKMRVYKNMYASKSFSYLYPTKKGRHNMFHHVVIKIRHLFLRPAAYLTSTHLETGVDASDCNTAGTNSLTCLNGGARDNKFWSPIQWLTATSNDSFRDRMLSSLTARPSSSSGICISFVHRKMTLWDFKEIL